jgi:hypothetical protein
MASLKNSAAWKALKTHARKTTKAHLRQPVDVFERHLLDQAVAALRIVYP